MLIAEIAKRWLTEKAQGIAGKPAINARITYADQMWIHGTKTKNI